MFGLFCVFCGLFVPVVFDVAWFVLMVALVVVVLLVCLVVVLLIVCCMLVLGVFVGVLSLLFVA